MKYGSKEFVSNSGSPIHVVYSPKVNKDGSVTLVESGVQNTDEIIQSYAESCDFYNILNRINNGEIDLLNKVPGQYGDFTNLPKSFGEFLQLQIDSKKLFWSLPVEVRSKFDNDYDKFLVQSGTQDWYKNIESVLPDDVKKMIFPVDEKPVESEVKE